MNQTMTGGLGKSPSLQKQETEYYEDEDDYYNDPQPQHHGGGMYDGYSSYNTVDDYFNEEEENHYLEEQHSHEISTGAVTTGTATATTASKSGAVATTTTSSVGDVGLDNHHSSAYRDGSAYDHHMLNGDGHAEPTQTTQMNPYKTENNNLISSISSTSNSNNNNTISFNEHVASTASAAATTKVTTTTTSASAQLPSSNHHDYDNNNELIDEDEEYDDYYGHMARHTDPKKLDAEHSATLDEYGDANNNNSGQFDEHDVDDEYLDKFDEQDEMYGAPAPPTSKLAHIKKQESILDDDIELRQLEEEQKLRQQNQQQSIYDVAQPLDPTSAAASMLEPLKHNKKTVTICEDDITKRDSPKPPEEKRTAKQRWHWAYNKVLQQLAVSTILSHIPLNFSYAPLKDICFHHNIERPSALTLHAHICVTHSVCPIYIIIFVVRSRA